MIAPLQGEALEEKRDAPAKAVQQSLQWIAFSARIVATREALKRAAMIRRRALAAKDGAMGAPGAADGAGGRSTLVSVLGQQVGNLTDKQREIAKLILEDPEHWSYASTRALAERLETHPATLVRFAQRLGFQGFSDLRQNIRHYYLSTLKPSEALTAHDRVKQDHPSLSVPLEVDIENLLEFRRSFNTDAVQQMALRIAQARKTLVVATGSHAAAGLVLAHQCRFMGRDVELENRGGSYLGQRLSTLTVDDHIIGIAFWRASKAVVLSLQWAREKKILASCITDNVFSPAAELSDVTLVAPTEGASYFQSLVAPLSAIHCILQATRDIDPEYAEEKIRLSQEAYDHLALFVDGR